MKMLEFSKKGQELIQMYEKMAKEGYDRIDDVKVVDAFSDFELRAYSDLILKLFTDNSISSVLDYGCGGSNWEIAGFDNESGKSAIEFFNLQKAFRYEPARALDERQAVDCVVSFDMLEHVFVSDVPLILRNIFSYATKLVILNIACYPAAATLPNGENAHITVRDPSWWKGMVDCISIEYPDILVSLLCSPKWRVTSVYPVCSPKIWEASDSFITLTGREGKPS